MNKKIIQLVAMTALLSSTVTLFQNCGEEMDLSAYSQNADLGSEGPGTDPTSTPTPTLPPPPAITVAPQSTTVTEFQPFSINIQASGDNLSYRWFQGSTELAGVTGAAYSVAQASNSHAGTYRVEVSNAYGTDAREFTITVSADPNRIPPAIAAPAAAMAALYSTDSSGTRYWFASQMTDPANYNLVRFAVIATGPNLTYQWYYVDSQDQLTAISGATDSVLLFNLTSAAQLGAYRVVVSNAYGQVASQASLSASPVAATVSGMYGGGGGTLYPAQACPAGTYGIGLQLRAGSNIDRAGIRCGNPTFSYSTAGYGGNGGTAYSLQCQGNRYLTGVNLATGSLVDRIQGVCTDKFGGNALNTGYYGGSGGVSFPMFRCPAGFVISEIRVRSGSRVDAIQFTCRFAL